jgi:glycosyltransferase involved in cell wall biosynthesis
VGKHGLGERVQFVGAKPARQAFGLGRLLVVPSRAESLPYIVLEAAAAGVPMIATQVGGIPEIFGPDAGALVAPGDPAALAQAISHAMQDRGTRHSASLRLKTRLRALFSADAMTDAILAAYREALAHKSG